MKKLTRRETAMLALLAVSIPFVAYRWWRPGTVAMTTPARRATVKAAPIPAIELSRLDAPRQPGEAGRRDLFAYGTPVRREAAPVNDPPPIIIPTPPPVRPANESSFVPAAAPVNLRYIAAVENKSGAKAAVFVTDKQEVLHGQAGELVAHRYRIARIGLESVDIEDVGTGQMRRLPLRGN